MKKWENPKLQDVCLEKTEVRGASCEKCTQALVKMRVSQVICFKCDCCGEEFHTTEYEGSSDLAQAAAEAHELTCCAQCS